MSMIYLEVPFEKKDYVKALDARWDNDLKKWCCDDGKKILIDEFSIVYLNVNYDRKEEAKLLGAKYDMKLKKWYTYSSNHSLINKFNGN